MYVPPDEPIQETGEINMNFALNEAHNGAVSGTHMPRGGQGYVSGSIGAARYEDGGAISAVNPIYQRSVRRPGRSRSTAVHVNHVQHDHAGQNHAGQNHAGQNHALRRSATTAHRTNPRIVTKSTNSMPKLSKKLAKGFDYLPPRNREQIIYITNSSLQNSSMFKPVKKSLPKNNDPKLTRAVILSENREMQFDRGSNPTGIVYENGNITREVTRDVRGTNNDKDEHSNGRNQIPNNAYENSETLQHESRTGYEFQSTNFPSSNSTTHNSVAHTSNYSEALGSTSQHENTSQNTLHNTSQNTLHNTSQNASHNTSQNASHDTSHDTIHNTLNDTSHESHGIDNVEHYTDPEIANFDCVIDDGISIASHPNPPVHSTPAMSMVHSDTQSVDTPPYSQGDARSIIYVNPESPVYATVNSVSHNDSLVFKF